ncbi:MAG: FAD-dependent oxidoreductase, partial [Defluviitaleaceae bacterium]|nr:FAD-dependent oxidoreductase [Defluviitaleaceae bacterium]
MDYRGLKSNSVFIEAGSFDDFGGWVLDTQFVEAMGSAFLLAHGLGKPVRDAVKRVTFPAEGTYRAFALTRDWVAPWKRGAAPGLFEIRVGDKKLGRVFGNEGAEWRWQFGGPIDINSRETVVALNDLTGFEGRVAALFFTMDENFSPPYEKAELENFRRQLTGNENERDLGDFDIVIAGGGISGICAALSSARGGLKTALVQDRPVVG